MMEFLRNDHRPTYKAGSRDAIASKNVHFTIGAPQLQIYDQTLDIWQGPSRHHSPDINQIFFRCLFGRRLVKRLNPASLHPILEVI